MNMDPSKAAGNGSVASSSVSSSSQSYLVNGGYPDKMPSSLNSDLSFPPGGISSLRLPVVVVTHLVSLIIFSCSAITTHDMNEVLTVHSLLSISLPRFFHTDIRF